MIQERKGQVYMHPPDRLIAMPITATERSGCGIQPLIMITAEGQGPGGKDESKTRGG